MTVEICTGKISFTVFVFHGNIYRKNSYFYLRLERRMKNLYPTYDINNLSTCHSINEIFSIDQFSDYLPGNPHTANVHRHSFYHITYFISGSGENVIDFKSYKILPNSIFFMKPGQVHSWDLDASVQGYVINFSPIFFDQLQISSSLLDEFPFFNVFHHQQMVTISEQNKTKLEGFFEQILEQSSAQPSRNSQIFIAAKLLSICAFVSSDLEKDSSFNEYNYNSLLFKRFVEAIESHFSELKMPKDYAELLHVTPSHLNFVAKQQSGISAGELIRERVILEAKRLLVNFNLSISSIADKLNYNDTSYFVKFFKKYTGFTPDVFRKQYYDKRE